MITRTALTSPRLLAAIKSAIIQAVKMSHSRVCPSAAVWVDNRRGEPSMYVQTSRGKTAQVFDLNGREITESVMEALRNWHWTARINNGRAHSCKWVGL